MNDRRLGVRVLALGMAAFIQVCGGLSDTYAQDVKNSSDHPLFPNRMPGYTISNYQQQAFASYAFRTHPTQTIEGKYTRIHY